MKYLYSLLLLIISIFTSACTTMVKPARFNRETGLPKGNAALVLPIRMISPKNDKLIQQCVFWFEKECQANTLYGISTLAQNSKLDDSIFYFEPGTYRVKDIECNGESIILDGAEKSFPSIHLSRGRFFYAGIFSVRELPNRRHVLLIEHTDVREMHEYISEEFSSLPPAADDNLFSPYSGRAITEEVISSTEGFSYTVVFNKSTGVKISKAELEKSIRKLSFESCYLEELDRSSIRLGSIQYELEFKDGIVSSIVKLPTAHAFTDAFETCVDTKIRTFISDNHENFTLRLRF